MGEGLSERDSRTDSRGRFSQSNLFYFFFKFNASDQEVEVTLTKRPSHENSMCFLQRLGYKGSTYPGTNHRSLQSTLPQLLFCCFVLALFSPFLSH